MSRYCNGICIMGYELIEGARGVAYAHPECELHSGYVEPEQCPEGDEHNRQCLEVSGHEPPCEFGPWPVPQPLGFDDAPPVDTWRLPEMGPGIEPDRGWGEGAPF